MTADNLADFLESVVGRSVLTYLPDQLDDVVMVRFTGGPRDAELPTLHEPSFQVFIRDRDAVVAESLARQVEKDLHGTNAQIGPHMCAIYSKIEPISLGIDEKQRHMYSLNFELIYQD